MTTRITIELPTNTGEITQRNSGVGAIIAQVIAMRGTVTVERAPAECPHPYHRSET